MILFNYVVCILGALLCLYALLTKRIDNNQIYVFLYFSVTGLSWCTWFVVAKTHSETLTVEGIVARLFMLLATILAVYALANCTSSRPLKYESPIEAVEDLASEEK